VTFEEFHLPLNPFPDRASIFPNQLQGGSIYLSTDGSIYLSAIGERSLRYTIDQYLEHYHKERNHQGLDSKIIRPQFQHQENTGEIKCNERLGGLLNYYSRQAA
jgi:hypothetical protein